MVALLDVMQRHQKCVDIISQSCGVMYSLALQASARPLLLRAGCAQMMVTCTEVHTNNTSVIALSLVTIQLLNEYLCETDLSASQPLDQDEHAFDSDSIRRSFTDVSHELGEAWKQIDNEIDAESEVQLIRKLCMEVSESLSYYHMMHQLML